MMAIEEASPVTSLPNQLTWTQMCFGNLTVMRFGDPASDVKMEVELAHICKSMDNVLSHHSALGNQLFNVHSRQSYISKPPRCSPRWCWPRGCLTSWMSRRQAKARWASQSFPPLLYSQNNLKMARTNNRVDMGSIDKAGSTHHAVSELCLHNYTLN